MKESFFKLLNQSTEEIIFRKNPNYKNENKSINVEFSPEVQIKKFENNSAEVILKFQIFSEEKFEESPFFLSVTEKGIFEWSEDNLDQIDDLLKTSAPAVLLSYVRSIISQATAFSGYPSLIVPLINFAE